MPQSLREVEVGSTFRNDPRNAATNLSSAVLRCYTRQRCVQLVSQWRNKISGQVAPSVTAPLVSNIQN